MDWSGLHHPSLAAGLPILTYLQSPHAVTHLWSLENRLWSHERLYAHQAGKPGDELLTAYERSPHLAK